MSRSSRRLAALVVTIVGAGVLPAWSVGTATAAPDDQSFTALRGFEPTGSKIRVEPQEYAATRVDLVELRSELPRGSAWAVVEIPDPDGRLQSFRVLQTQTMESELAAAHPEITTWAGRSVTDPRVSIALDITPMGFHAFVREPGARADWYVDPAYDRRGTTAHLSYRSSSLPAPAQRRAEGEVTALRETITAAQGRTTAAGAPVQRHFYRLALTSDPSYAAYFGTANVLAEKVTLINRVNQIYNNDLATELRLVNDTDKLNLDTDAKATGANGPCGTAPCFEPYDDNGTPVRTDDVPGELDYCDVPTLGKNRTVLGQLIGASSYDIGHIALGNDGGGIAYLGIVGGDYKGGGCTGLPRPTGDFFALDYVAHEMGHQFSGNHTFNGELGFCGGNISEASVEPGSGSSVMAYAGICGRDDLQPHTDPYFSFKTIDEVDAYREAPYRNVEVQTVSLRSFDTNNETLTLGYEGATASVKRGTTYTNAGVEAAVESITGTDVTVVPWGYDEVVDSGVDPIDDTGFQVIFNDEATVFEPDSADVDLPSLTVSGAGDVVGFVGETARGGLSQNDGVPVPRTPDVADNTAPVAQAPVLGDRTIPVRTPFALTGSGTDADGDELVYLWEQTNNGDGTELATNTKSYGPLFRVFGDDAVVSTADSLKVSSPGENLADGSPTRVFPDMAQVLSGNTNAATGRCPDPVDAGGAPLSEDDQLPDALLDCYSEFLPTSDYLGSAGVDDRVMTFRITARDLFPIGGGLAHDEIALKVDPSAGPFLVTSQGTAGATVAGGTSVPVTWAVNNTQALAPTVKISLSTDGGATFGTVLATSTPNDGSQALTMPNVTAGDVRIKIEAVDNYFFDVNDASFALTATPAPETTITSGPEDGSIVLKKRKTFAFTSSTTPATFVCALDSEVVECKDGSATVKIKPGTHELSVAAVNAAGVADATPATRTFTRPYDDGALKRVGSWERVKNDRAYGDDFIVSDEEGDTLARKIRRASSIGLVVVTGKNAGTVKVFVGKEKIRTVRLKGKKRFNVIKLVDLGDLGTGWLRIVVGTDEPVKIAGVAVVTDRSGA